MLSEIMEQIKLIMEQMKTIGEEDFQKELKEANTDAERELISFLHSFHNRHWPKNVFHYTDFSALEGILCGEGIRLCRSDNMNDKGEMRNFIELLKDSVIKRFPDDMQMVSKIEKRFALEQKKRESEISYLASFSTWEDDVSQWERYGNRGCGVSIAFDAAILCKIAGRKMVSLQEVFYGKDADNHKATDMFEDLFRGKDMLRHFGKADWDGVFENVWGVSVAHKQQSFASEQEFRLVTLPKWNGKRHDELGNAHIVSTPSGFRECLYLDWREGCDALNISFDKLITRITIGPRSALKEEELQEWLISKKLGCLCTRVTKSASTWF